MRLRNTFLLILSGASALTALGCSDGGGGGKTDDDASTCEGDDCADGGVASGDGSSADPCSDGKKSGDETGVDCGGSCAACEGEGCTAGDECASGVCSGGKCGAASCGDGLQNGGEEGIDCGGSCAETCAPPCDGDNCAPTAGFTVELSGSGPTTATATSAASRGSAVISSTRYDWGDGTGSGTSATHTYEYSGDYVVTQTVIDAEGRVDTASQAVTVTGGFKPVRLNPADVLSAQNYQNGRQPESTIRLQDDGRVVEVRGMENGAVRTDAAIAPQSPTAFYFEGEGLTDRRNSFWGFGVTTGTATLDGSLGGSSASFGVYMRGEVTASSSTSFGLVCAGTSPTTFVKIAEASPAVGFVVDYRSTRPTIHVIHRPEGESPSVACSVTMSAVSTELFGLFAGARQVVGPQARINTGADTVNRPFSYSPSEVIDALAAANVAAPIAANQITWGFGSTHARAPSAAPVLTAPGDQSVAVGATVSLAATANDADEGDVTDKIEWAYRPTVYTSPVRGYGGSFSFAPDEPGVHIVEVSVIDSTGKRVTNEVEVVATGALASENGVRFDESASVGERVEVTPDGLGVYFTDAGNFKDGIRINQGLIDDFWYFEGTRLFQAGEFPYNMGFGLTTRDASLAPYSTHDTPWSMSINVTAGVWRDLIDVGNLDTGTAVAENIAVQNQTRYGFAVDYRGAFPVVYVLTSRGTTGAGVTGDQSGPLARLVARVEMPDVHGPVYPFVYGGEGPSGSEQTPAAVFRVAPPFGFTNVAQALQTAPNPNTFPPVEPITAQDAAALKLGWGL